MYAIVDISGKQFKVSKKDRVLAPKLAAEAGKNVSLDRVLLISDKNEITVGQPFIDGATVTAKVVGFDKDKKVVVFKKKRRKGYQVKRGHRQEYTELEIQSITAKSKADSKAKPKKAADSKPEPAKRTAKKAQTEKAKAKKPAAKKTQPKKAQPKKASTGSSGSTKGASKTAAGAGKAQRKAAGTKKASAKTGAKKTAGDSSKTDATQSGGARKTSANKKAEE